MTTPFSSQAIRFERKTGGNQTPADPDGTVTFDFPDVGDGYLCPNADGVKDFFVAYTILWRLSGGTGALPTFRVRVGATGTLLDALIWEGQDFANASAGQPLDTVFFAKIPAPGAGDVVTLSIARPAGTATVLVSGGTVPTEYSSLLIWEA